MKTECPVCGKEFGGNLLAYIFPCKERHLICHPCLKRLFEDGSGDSNNCSLSEGKCPRPRHAKCPTCEKNCHLPLNNLHKVPHIPRSNADLDTILRTSETITEIKECCERLKQLGTEAIKDLEKLLKKINRHERSCRIATVIGASASVIASVAYIGSVISTGGVTAGVLPFLGAAGGATTAGAGVFSLFQSKNAQNKTKKVIETLTDTYADLTDIVRMLENAEVIRFFRTSGNASGALFNVVHASEAIRKVIAAGRYGNIFCGALIVFDFATLIWNIKEIARNSPSDASVMLTTAIKNIKYHCITKPDEMIKEFSKPNDEAN